MGSGRSNFLHLKNPLLNTYEYMLYKILTCNLVLCVNKQEELINALVLTISLVLAGKTTQDEMLRMVVSFHTKSLCEKV